MRVSLQRLIKSPGGSESEGMDRKKVRNWVIKKRKGACQIWVMISDRDKENRKEEWRQAFMCISKVI